MHWGDLSDSLADGPKRRAPPATLLQCEEFYAHQNLQYSKRTCIRSCHELPISCPLLLRCRKQAWLDRFPTMNSF